MICLIGVTLTKGMSVIGIPSGNVARPLPIQIRRLRERMVWEAPRAPRTGAPRAAHRLEDVLLAHAVRGKGGITERRFVGNHGADEQAL